MMRIFDFNIHLPASNDGNVEQTIYSEEATTSAQLVETFSRHYSNQKVQINDGNIIILNPNVIFEDQGLKPLVEEVQSVFSKSLFTLMIDFRQSNYHDAIDRSIEAGIDGIKFHSYVQRISNTDFPEALETAKYASDRGLFICIDTSYGTTKLYENDNLKLATMIADEISDVPIVLLHSGGARIIEAMLIAEDKNNVWLETSFTLPYYLGSSVEQDMTFAYKKLGSERILFGSDAPYVNSETAVDKTIQFFEKHKFSSEDIENILFNNAMKRFCNVIK